ncbi:MAG: NAD-dependent epimerase/dehydratase family protein [Oxalobacteraceae bacterium]|nr:MAG: NAD-dependent epimerase/dehydratase family protein [Oxalobacteraceae bacterium]
MRNWLVSLLKQREMARAILSAACLTRDDGLMQVLVVGGSGFIGSRIVERLSRTGWARPVVGGRRAAASLNGVEFRSVDSTNSGALDAALSGVDAVVNCVAGDQSNIADGARLLAQACLRASIPRVTHLSSMAVYAHGGGVDLRENSPLVPPGIGYAGAKRQAEAHMATLARGGSVVFMLRPGCVFGPGSSMWVCFIAELLRQGRIGHLGGAGDGWSNLVHVDTVADAVVASLHQEGRLGEAVAVNLAAPDSPHWNQYFQDLAAAIGVAPKQISPRLLQLDAWLSSAIGKVARPIAARFGSGANAWPQALHPSFLQLWSRQARMDASFAQQALGLQPSSYRQGLNDSVEWLLKVQRVT